MSVRVCNVGRFSIGLFSYWLGFSFRHLGAYNRVIDCGPVKVMWSKRHD